ncbi:hypothetical protein [Blastococcus sp. TF02A-26]|uniref:hypothetical protein n=1 Tax=Blastococcus sp. TF02A-26 TaxID=2250577 RepID=UPI0018F449E6|nr:hypothetical protein [Blastococcus sp. TF02A-26]
MSEPTAPPVPARPMQETGPIPPYFGPMGRTAQNQEQAPSQAPQPRTAEGTTPDTAEAAAVPAGATAAGAVADAPTLVEPAVPAPDAEPPGDPVAAWALTGDTPPPGPDDAPPVLQPGTFPTTPVTSRPTVRARRRDPMTRMGPWAPAAGGLLGLVAGLVVVALLAGRADAFGEGLALVFLVVGLSMLGAAGALLADEVRLVRRGAREAAVRPAWVEATSSLLNGLTPARLLLASSAFVLFLAAYVGR